jgi:hypothetical protein
MEWGFFVQCRSLAAVVLVHRFPRGGPRDCLMSPRGMKRACLFGKASEWVGLPSEDLIPHGPAFVRLMLPASAWVVIWDTGSAAMAAGIVTAVVTVGRSIAVILKALNAMMKARKNAAIYTTDAPPKLRRFRSLHHCASMWSVIPSCEPRTAVSREGCGATMAQTR